MPKIKDYFRFIKFSHTIFALPFALIGFFLAINETNNFDWKLLIFVLLCMIFARSAAMGFNRLIDKEIDKKNPRTSNREIPKGIITEKNALIFVIINSLLFVCCTYFINKLVFYLSFVALFVILGYSYTKRFTALSHLILGLGLSFAPIGAYLVVKPQFDLLPVLFSIVVLFWVSGFDIIYALQDFEFDKKNNLKSIPVILGKKNALLLSRFFHFITATTLIIIKFVGNFGLFYMIGAAIFINLLIYQQAIVKPNDLSRVNFAFFNLNGYASVILSIFTILDIFLKI